MQSQEQPKQPPGIVFITAMSRPDAALALAMMCGFEVKQEARLAAIAVAGSGLGAAAFCDVVERVYLPPRAFGNSNVLLPVGLVADEPLPPDPPMVRAALERRDEKGKPAYARGVFRVTDTAEVPALVRNSLTDTTDANATVILSAPATSLARTLDLAGVRDLVTAKVKALVICDSGAAQDLDALRKVLAAWPTPVVLCDRELGESLPYPASSIERDFAWAPANPVVDAYRSYRSMPYDAPSWDMAAVLYAMHPQGFFELSDPDGKRRTLTVSASERDKIIRMYIEIASAKPVPPPPRPQKKE